MPEEVTKKRICKRCLLFQVPDMAELARVIQERIDLLPEDEKAAEQVMQDRLSLCKMCDHLNDGTCGLCGCYVELRAAKRHMHCPCVPKKW